jgi:hypothetical protein
MDVTQPSQPNEWTPRETPTGPPQIIYTRALPKSRHAVVSLVAGIVGPIAALCLAASAPYLIGAVSAAAVITGHLAFSEIKDSGGMLGGKGIALAGLILGYPVVALWILATIGLIAQRYG